VLHAVDMHCDQTHTVPLLHAQQPALKNSSRFRGVSLNKASRKWEARIRESGKNHYLGSFTNEELAAHAFDNAAIAMRGPSAVCNFPREGSNVKVRSALLLAISM
jgi:hypothetical protein